MKTIELFGEKLELYERSAYDIEVLRNIAEKDDISEPYQFAIVIYDSLKRNIPAEPKWYQFKKKRKYDYLKKIIDRDYFYLNLHPGKLMNLGLQILEYEGIDIKKKMEELGLAFPISSD